MSFKPINNWTKQGIIDHISKEFVEKSTVARNGANNSIVCAYRGENGAKCAAGMFIPDKKYSATMEGNNIGTLTLNDSSLMKRMPLGLDGMAQLQRTHDLSRNEFCLADMLEWVEKNVED